MSSPSYPHSQPVLDEVKVVTAALQSATMTADQVSGANHVLFINTGTTPGNLQLPPVADVIGKQGGPRPFIMEIRNNSGSANTATITTNTGWTLSGAMTIAQNTTRRFAVTWAGNAGTLTSMGMSQAAA